MTLKQLTEPFITAWRNAEFNLFFMKLAILNIGAGICIFSSDGYTTLFNSKVFAVYGWETSSVGVFMILLELGVLAYITHMFAEWYRKTWMQKLYLGIVLLCFSLLCYSGMSSYLWDAYSAEYADVRSLGVKSNTLDTGIRSHQNFIKDLDVRLIEQKDRISEIEGKVSNLNKQITKNSKDKSDRRRLVSDCSATVDCASAIEDLSQAGATLERSLISMLNEKEYAQGKYEKLESRKEDLLTEITQLQQERNSINLKTDGMDAEREDKISSINSIVIAVYKQLGKPAPADPFKVAVNFIAIIIYPCYILLNMCLGFNSRGNRLAARLKSKHQTWPLRRFRPTQKIIIPVPADATAAELKRYVEMETDESATLTRSEHQTTPEADLSSIVNEESVNPVNDIADPYSSVQGRDRV